MEKNIKIKHWDTNETDEGTEPTEEASLLGFRPRDNNNKDYNIMVDPITHSDVVKSVCDTYNGGGYDGGDVVSKEEKDLTRAVPDIYIQRASSNSESTYRLDIFNDQVSKDVSRRTRKLSNRFLVNTVLSSEELFEQPSSPEVSNVRVEDDEVFVSDSSPDTACQRLFLQVPIPDTFDNEPVIFRQLPASDTQESDRQSISRISSHSPDCKETGKIAEQGRRFAYRQTERLIYKNGSCSVSSKNVPRGHYSCFNDIFTTFLDLRWRYNLIIFAATFVGSWFFFAMLWWVTAVLNGDHLTVDNQIIHESDFLAAENFSINGLAKLNFTSNASGTQDGTIPTHLYNLNASIYMDIETKPDVVPHGCCVEGVNNFMTALLFSVETQQTIGYGTRYSSASCPHALILLIVQCLVGIILQSLMTGIVYSKLCKPKSRAHTMMFSKFAVICLRDDQYCLLFRVGDMRKSYLIGTSIRALVVRAKDGDERLNPLCQHTMELEFDQDSSNTAPLLMWPVTMVHPINESSPLWGLSIHDLVVAKFEIVIVLEGTLEHTGMTAQFRTSYLPSEILWGHHLQPLMTRQKQNGKYAIDFDLFDKVIPIKHMPDCSAKEYAVRRDRGSKISGNNPTSFAPGGFIRNSSQRLWPRVRKILKSREIREDKNHNNDHSIGSTKLKRSATLSARLVPHSATLNRRSVDIFSNATRSFLKAFKSERSNSIRNDYYCKNVELGNAP